MEKREHLCAVSENENDATTMENSMEFPQKLKKNRITIVVQLLIPFWLFVTPWTIACHTSLFLLFPRACSNSCPLSQWCHQTISFCHSLILLLSIFPSIRVFSNESTLHIRWPKFWSYSFSIRPFQWTIQGVFSSITVWKHQFFGAQPSLWSNSHIPKWLLEKS